MIKKIIDILCIPPFLRSDYNSTVVSTRKRRFWIFNFWVLAGGLTYYQLKDIARSEEQGQFFLYEWFTGRKSIFQRKQEELEEAINAEFEILLNTPMVQDDQSFYETFGQEAVDNACNCDTENPEEQHYLGCEVWTLVRTNLTIGDTF